MIRIKHFMTLVLIAFFCINTYCQPTILVTRDKKDYYEEYTALVSSQKIKHGSYLKLDKSMVGNHSLAIFGMYSYGKKDGYWETYYKGTNNIKDKGYYKNDKKDSVWTIFYFQGVVRKFKQVQSEEGVQLQIIDANPIISRTGNYLDDKAVGIWEFFDVHSELLQQYNYDTESLVYFKDHDLKNIETGFIGGEDLLNRFLYETFNPYGIIDSIHSTINLKTSKMVFKFTIDERGRIKDIINTENTIRNKKIYYRAIKTIMSLDKQFYPKKVDGVSQKSEKTITFDLKVDSNTHHYSTSNEISWLTNKKFNMYIILN